MNKGIFIDLDGTLLNSDENIDKKNKDAIQILIKNGYNVYFMTGKSLSQSFRYYSLLKLDTYMVTWAGHYISRGTKKIKEYALNKDYLTTLMKNIGNKLTYSFQTKNDIFTNKDSKEFKKLFGDEYVISDNFLTEDNLLGFYISVCDFDEKEIDRIAILASEKFDVQLWNFTDFKILSLNQKGINKGSALEWIKKKDNLDYTVAIGDGYNDIPTFMKSDVSYSVQNSCQPLKDISTHILESDNNQNALYEAVNHIFNSELN